MHDSLVTAVWPDGDVDFYEDIDEAAECFRDAECEPEWACQRIGDEAVTCTSRLIAAIRCSDGPSAADHARHEGMMR